MESVLFDAAGHRRSPATMPGFHQGRSPRNKGLRYPADPPTIEEIIAVMRAAGDSADGVRLRALIVILWRAGLRIVRRSTSLGPISIRRAELCWFATARAAGAERSAWIAGHGPSWSHGWTSGASCPLARCCVSFTGPLRVGTGSSPPLASSSAEQQRQRECGDASHHTSSGTPTRSRWHTRGFRWSSSSDSSGMPTSESPRSVNQAESAVQS